MIVRLMGEGQFGIVKQLRREQVVVQITCCNHL